MVKFSYKEKDGDWMGGIGKNIMERRKALGMTQEELAKKMGYKSKSTINKIENGTNDIPQSKIAKFAGVLETTPAYLMGWETKVEENPVGEANKLADWYLGLEMKEEEDVDFIGMINEYKQLDESKQAQVREYVHFLLGRD